MTKVLGAFGYLIIDQSIDEPVEKCYLDVNLVNVKVIVGCVEK